MFVSCQSAVEKCGVTKCVGWLLLFLQVCLSGALHRGLIWWWFNILTHYLRNRDTRQVLARKASLDKSCSIINDYELLLIEKDLHFLKFFVYGCASSALHFEFKFIF